MPLSTSRAVSASSSRSISVRYCAISWRRSPSVLPMIRALRKFAASVSAEAGRPGGRLSSRFSTVPSSATSTTSARAGSSLTNSICLSRALALVVTTTPAPRDRPDSSAEASVSVASSVRWLAAARICASIRERSSLVRLPTSIIASTKKRRPALGRQPPGRGVGRVDQPRQLQIGHDIAHRRRRQRHRQQAGDVARADRLPGGEIAIDDLAEDFPRALVGLDQPAGGFRARVQAHGRIIHVFAVGYRFCDARVGIKRPRAAAPA